MLWNTISHIKWLFIRTSGVRGCPFFASSCSQLGRHALEGTIRAHPCASAADSMAAQLAAGAQKPGPAEWAPRDRPSLWQRRLALQANTVIRSLVGAILPFVKQSHTKWKNSNSSLLLSDRCVLANLQGHVYSFYSLMNTEGLNSLCNIWWQFSSLAENYLLHNCHGLQHFFQWRLSGDCL